MKRKKRTYKPGQKNFLVKIYFSLKNSVIKDFKVKLFALAFAIILWIYTILGNHYTYVFNVPLEVTNIKSGKTLKEPVAEIVEAEFTASGSDLVYLFLSPASSFRFNLDLETIRYFFNFDLMDYFQKHPEDIVIPRSLEVVFNKIISPDSVTIELDNEITKVVPIKPLVYIDTESGYIKTKPLKINPQTIQITGPDFYIRQIDKVYTDSLHKNNIKITVDMQLGLKLPENSTVKYEINDIHIRQVVEQISEKIIKDIPVKVINKDKNLTIEIVPEKISLKVSGGLSDLTRLKGSDFEILFDYKKSWLAGEAYYTPEIRKPEQVVDIINIIPKRLNVRVIRERVNK